MARERNRPTPSQREGNLGNKPFKGLGALIQKSAKSAPPPRVPVSSPPPKSPAAATNGNGSNAHDSAGDADLFLREMNDVKPFAAGERQRVAAPRPASTPRPMISDDAEALAELADLVTGKAPFDLSDSDEYLEGAVAGIDPRIVRRLRRGEFAHQAHLDLHRLTSEQARVEVDRFLLDAYRSGRRCVLIIHGRGLNSKDQIPVLKRRLAMWLARGQWSRLVLAFTTARPVDGGAGAVYVLLRR